MKDRRRNARSPRSSRRPVRPLTHLTCPGCSEKMPITNCIMWDGAQAWCLACGSKRKKRRPGAVTATEPGYRIIKPARIYLSVPSDLTAESLAWAMGLLDEHPRRLVCSAEQWPHLAESGWTGEAILDRSMPCHAWALEGMTRHVYSEGCG